VLVVGHSYAPKFCDQLVKEANLRVRSQISSGLTTECFAAFLRNPELLDHCRVVVWITTEQHLTHFHAMPEPIMAALKEPK
jgi:hypothetical protein